MNTNKPSFIDQPARQFLLSAGAVRLIIGAQALAMNACAFTGASLFADVLGGLKPASRRPVTEPASQDAMPDASSVGSTSEGSDTTSNAANSNPVKTPRAASTRRRTAKK